MATISGGSVEDFEADDEGRLMGLSGLAKRASSCADCLLLGERARFLVAWPLRGSRCTGMDSGMFSDICEEVIYRKRRCVCDGAQKLFVGAVEMDGRGSA